MKKFLLVFLLLLIIFSLPLFSEEEEKENIEEIIKGDTFLEEILLSDVPITYGDERFRERILERTKGERDPIGLVLTGGSARACAHIGVLRYLDEIGLIPDYIVSNSMGSIIGMLYAAGVKPDQIESIMLAGDISQYFAITLPRDGGFLDTAGFRNLIEGIVGKDYNMEDTEIPVMVVSDDLVTKREVRVTEGNFIDVLIGSFALPAYFNPLKYKGHLLVDGGVISLAPIDAAFEYSDTVILSTTLYDPESTNLLNPITIINVSFDIGKRQNVASDLKKYTSLIWIRCGVENFSFMAFDECSVMADIGYENAKEHEKELLSLVPYSVGKNDREEVEESLKNIKTSLKYFGNIKSQHPQTSLFLGLSPLEDKTSTYYLKNSFLISFNYRFKYGPVDITVLGGPGIDLQNLASSAAFMGLGAVVNYYPLSMMRLRGDFYMDFLRTGAEFKPVLYLREAYDVFLFSFDNSSLSFHETLEYSKDFALHLYKGISLSLKLRGDLSSKNSSGEYMLGYLLTGEDILFKNAKQYIEASFSSKASIIGNVTGKISFLLRYSVDGKDSVPLFISDGYTSRYITYGAKSLYTSREGYAAILSFDVGYSFQTDPTFGEMLTMKSSYLGAYFSTLISSSSIGFSIGLDARTTFSIIGLIKLPFALRIGWEYIEGESKLTSSITFGSI